MKTLSELVNIPLEMLSAPAESHFYNYLGFFLIAIFQSKLTKKDLCFQKSQVSEQISEDSNGKSGQSGERSIFHPTVHLQEYVFLLMFDHYFKASLQFF